MAGDWIKMRSDLRTHPKVVRLSSALKADRLRIVGGLHAVWCLFDAHSTDGSLEGYTHDAIDDLIGWPGFARAMEAVEWIEVDLDGGIWLPDFDTHNGASAKRRAQDSDRKRRDREEKEAAEKAVRDASAAEADKKRTREEERREEKKEKPKRAARATSLPPGFQISERVRTWAAEKGLNHLDEQLEAFVSYAKRKGATYADWDEALMAAIRENWAKVDRSSEFKGKTL